jgi:hypothetical protein
MVITKEKLVETETETSCEEMLDITNKRLRLLGIGAYTVGWYLKNLPDDTELSTLGTSLVELVEQIER